MDNIIREFLWNGRKAKIAYKILQNSKENGGLNLVNLENRDKALKTSWVQILNGEEEYSSLVYGVMRCSTLGKDIWRCRLNEEDVYILKIKSVFWEDVLKCWCNYNYYRQVRTENQLIWYNSSIKVAGKPFFWRDAYQRGLKFVYQLFTKGGFISESTALQQFGIGVMRLNSLKAAIPGEMVAYFSDFSPSCFLPIAPHNYDVEVYVYRTGLAKRAYKNLEEDVLLIHNKYIKWRQDLGQEFPYGIIEFGKLHLDIFRITNIPKYRSFQYRLLQRGLVTNVHLFKWQMRQDELCTFCRTEVESMVHLFFECKVVKSLLARNYGLLSAKV